jgi:ABC-2 type transport system ATP-binding protein
MIRAENLTKRFSDLTALDKLTLTVDDGNIFGLVGTNGSGKSTFLRLLSGVYVPDEGHIAVEGEDTYENPRVKDSIFFVSDDLYFLPQSSLDEMARFYKAVYTHWSDERYVKLCTMFPIDRRKKLGTFSKGMRRQAALILALASMPRYLLLDEAFDGLDPVIRFAVRRLIADEMSTRPMTVLISSHNLRELEDFCDRIALIHAGKLIMECAMDEIKNAFTKVQVALKRPADPSELEEVQVMAWEIKGSMGAIILKADADKALEAVRRLDPALAEVLPLTLEEVFIYEMEAAGYDYNKVLF